MRWINCYCHDPKNLGDQLSSPCRWFPELSHIPFVPIQEIQNYDLQNTGVIFGGGGMIYGESERKMARVVETGVPVVLWGCGTNWYDGKVVFPKWLQKCKLVGLRDWDSPYSWVGCPSCFIPGIEEAAKINPVFPAVNYQHRERPRDWGIRVTMTNEQGAKKIGEVLEFLGKADRVVTNSYHGAYWALLMERTIDLPDVWSSKFNTLPPMGWKDCSLLQLARVSNILFFKRVKQLMENYG